MVRSQRLTRSPIVNVMSTAVFEAAKSLLRDFNDVEHLQVSRKGTGDFVSKADQRSEKIIRQHLQKAHPDYGLLLEEMGEIEGDGINRFIVDPLDGTKNFLHGIPHFSISVAYEKHGKIEAGVVYNPITDELFWTERGMGAFMNTNRLRVSSRESLENAILITELPGFGHDPQPHKKALFDIFRDAPGFRSFGCASLNLAYVAAGRAECYADFDLNPWDVAAGLLIVQEAGGVIESIDRKNHTPESGKSVMACNQALAVSMSMKVRRTLKAE